MERLFPIKKVLVPSDGGPYYCSYTGDQLDVGTEVWHIRILENDGDRYKQWVVASNIPPCASISPEFTKSIRVYFIKTEVTSLCSLFYTKMEVTARPLSPMEISRSVRKIVKAPLMHPSVKPATIAPSTGIPPDRTLSINTMWLMLNKLRVFIRQEDVGNSIWKKGGSTIPFNTDLESCIECMKSVVDRETASANLTVILFTSTFMKDFDGTIGIESLVTDPEVAEYMFNVHAAVLDFVDIMFPFKSQSQSPLIVRHQFNMDLFGIRNGDGGGSDEKKILPKLNNPSSVLLEELFTQSYHRNEYYVSMGRIEDHKTRKERVETVQTFMIQHPFLFVSLFYLIFEECPLSKRPTFMECNQMLNCMNLFINTSTVG
jgi:hypothetical protein